MFKYGSSHMRSRWRDVDIRKKNTTLGCLTNTQFPPQSLEQRSYSERKREERERNSSSNAPEFDVSACKREC